MGETNNPQGTNQNQLGQTTPPADKGIASSGDKGSTSTPRTYTEKEHTEAIEKIKSDILAEAGRKYKPIEEQNTLLTTQLQGNQNSIKSYETKIAKLNEQIESITKDSGDAQKLAAKLKELEILEKTYKDAEPDIQEAKKYKYESLAKKIAEDYEGADADKLIRLSEQLKDRTETAIRTVAEMIWKKKEAPPATPPANPKIVPDSGVTSGGETDLTKISFSADAPSASQMISEGLKKKK
jgi:hypothetical protein